MSLDLDLEDIAALVDMCGSLIPTHELYEQTLESLQLDLGYDPEESLEGVTREHLLEYLATF